MFVSLVLLVLIISGVIVLLPKPRKPRPVAPDLTKEQLDDLYFERHMKVIRHDAEYGGFFD